MDRCSAVYNRVACQQTWMCRPTNNDICSFFCTGCGRRVDWIELDVEWMLYECWTLDDGWMMVAGWLVMVEWMLMNDERWWLDWCRWKVDKQKQTTNVRWPMTSDANAYVWLTTWFTSLNRPVPLAYAHTGWRKKPVWWVGHSVSEASSNFSSAIQNNTGVSTFVAFHSGSLRYRSNIECRAEADRLFTFTGIS